VSARFCYLNATHFNNTPLSLHDELYLCSGDIMALEIKQKDEIWTIEVNEKFAFENFEQMEIYLKMLLSIKKEHGNFIQLNKEQRLRHFKERVIEDSE
jgi:hypothetical protein